MQINKNIKSKIDTVVQLI